MSGLRRSGPPKRKPKKQRRVAEYKEAFVKEGAARKRARKKARVDAQYGEHAEWVRTLPCFVCEKHGYSRQLARTVAAHAGRTKGAGGKAKDLVDLCGFHELNWHWLGWETFDKKHGVDCKARAAYLWAISPIHIQEEAA